MNSLGKSSKWPSYDSLPSTSSSPPSEDEADIFSEGEGDGVLKSSLNSKFNDDQCELYPDEAKHLSPGAAALRSSTPGDLTFAKKVSTVSLKQAFSFYCFIFLTKHVCLYFQCADLHRYIRPLLKLLQGLKTGRFDKGLWINYTKYCCVINQLVWHSDVCS